MRDVQDMIEVGVSNQNIVGTRNVRLNCGHIRFGDVVAPVGVACVTSYHMA